MQICVRPQLLIVDREERRSELADLSSPWATGKIDRCPPHGPPVKEVGVQDTYRDIAILTIVRRAQFALRAQDVEPLYPAAHG